MNEQAKNLQEELIKKGYTSLQHVGSEDGYAHIEHYWLGHPYCAPSRGDVYYEIPLESEHALCLIHKYLNRLEIHPDPITAHDIK